VFVVSNTTLRLGALDGARTEGHQLRVLLRAPVQPDVGRERIRRRQQVGVSMKCRRDDHHPGALVHGEGVGAAAPPGRGRGVPHKCGRRRP